MTSAPASRFPAAAARPDRGEDPAACDRGFGRERATDPSSSPETGLIEAARRDPRRFEDLYLRHRDAIGGYLVRRTGDRHAAEDLLADVFLRAHAALPRYRCDGVPFRAWLYRIATREVWRWSRAGRRGSATAGSNDETDLAPPDDAARREDAARLRRAIDRLPRRHRDVVYLHHVEELSVEHVAAALGCAPGTVKSRLSRARARLRVLLAE